MNRAGLKVSQMAAPAPSTYTMTEIRFYTVSGPFGQFSNFAPYPIEIDGKIYPTSEHYFQAMKFFGTPHVEEARLIPTPQGVADFGRRRDLPMRKDWDAVRDNVMRMALRAKFTQHESLRLLLVGTGNATIIEHTEKDRYWGNGGDGTGKNRLGELLMELRSHLGTSSDA